MAFVAERVLVSSHNGPGIVASGTTVDSVTERAAGGLVARCSVFGVAGNGVDVLLADRVVVEDCSVSGLVEVSETFQPRGVSVQDSTVVSVVAMSDIPGHGVFVNGSSWVSVERVEVTQTGQFAFGVFVADDCADVRVAGCHVHDVQRDGILKQLSERVIVAENLVHRTGDDAIATNGVVGTEVRPRDVVIANNVVFDAGSRGIAVMGRSDVLVEGNVVESTYMAGIGVEVFYLPETEETELIDYGPIREITVRGNHLVNPGMADFETGFTDGAGQAHGITVRAHGDHPASNVVVEGNVIRGCRNSFVRVWSLATDPEVRVATTVIRDNTLSGPVAHGSGGTDSLDPGEYHGVWVSAADGVVVEGTANFLYDSGWEATAATATWHLWGHLMRTGTSVARYATTMLWFYDDATVVRRDNQTGSITVDFGLAHELRTTGASQSAPSDAAVTSLTGTITVGTAS